MSIVSSQSFFPHFEQKKKETKTLIGQNWTDMNERDKHIYNRSFKNKLEVSGTQHQSILQTNCDATGPTKATASLLRMLYTSLVRGHDCYIWELTQ